MFVRIGVAARIIGVCTKTLRRWEQRGIIVPHRTAGNHRRYDREALERFRLTGVYEPQQLDQQSVAIYARVSSSRQKDDLGRQLAYLRDQPLVSQAKTVHEFIDIASGLNDTRKGLLRLLRAAATGQFPTVVITYPDRLSRFGMRILYEVMQSYGVAIHVLKKSPVNDPHQQIVDDIVALMHSFSGKLYRMRRGMTNPPVSASP